MSIAELVASQPYKYPTGFLVLFSETWFGNIGENQPGEGTK
jgi:hypothetical protein